MPTVNDIQIAMAVEAVAKRFYQGGVAPDLDEVLSKVSDYFAKNPVGNPVVLDTSSILSGQSSNVDVVNTLCAHVVYNSLVLYNTCTNQSQQILMQNTLLRTRLTSLFNRQQALKTSVEDAMLSLYNADGYYFTISDSFSDSSKTDLSLTSAFIDTTHNCVAIPSLGSFTQVVPGSEIGTPTISVTSSGQMVNYETISPFSFSTSGTTDTVWEIQVPLNAPGPVEVQVVIPLGSQTAPLEISRVDFNPYAMTPFQIYGEYGQMTGAATIDYFTFGSSITTSLNRISLSADAQGVISFRFTLNKTQYDFTKSVHGATQFVYIFGAKDIVFSQQTYDASAIFVSEPLQLYPDADSVIDAVSLATTSTIPANTSIHYFVAADNSIGATPNSNVALGDFDWQPIVPIQSVAPGNNVVNFNGAFQYQYTITDQPRGDDLQLLPIDTTNTDITQRNPNPLAIPGVDTYTLANFSQNFLTNSITLSEGINSTRIYYMPSSSFVDLPFWNTALNEGSINGTAPTTTYGRIDQGNGFFYGGDVGMNGAAIYVETYVDLPDKLPPVIGNLVKADLYSQSWTVKTYLNGAQVAYLPGKNTLDAGAGLTPLDNELVTWNFQQGLNHVALAIYIPNLQQVSNVSSPYLGTLQLIQNEDLFDLGQVKLADWSYVSYFDLTYNTSGTPSTFTVYNDQIITRRPPTTNYLLRFNQTTGFGPQAIRVRADLARSVTAPNVTPQLQSYRVRFQYGDN